MIRRLLLGAALAIGTTLLPPQTQELSALGAIIVLGVPHGALDGELARVALRPRLGRAWFTVFALPYLALSALVLVAWRVAPVATLSAFLGLSVWHFGAEDAPGRRWPDKLLRGGLPIAAPILARYGDTVALFTTITGAPLSGFAFWWRCAALIWAVLAVLWTARALNECRWADLIESGLLLAAFLVLPPLTAFAVYFVCVHAPAHTAALIDDERAARLRDTPSACWHAVPVTALTVLLGAALWPLYDGAVAPRLLALTIQGLAALTLPHMILGAWFEALGASTVRAERRFARGPAGATGRGDQASWAR